MSEHRSSQEGGRCAFATQQDRVRAITQARALVASQVLGLHYPCRETIHPYLALPICHLLGANVYARY